MTYATDLGNRVIKMALIFMVNLPMTTDQGTGSSLNKMEINISATTFVEEELDSADS